MRGGKLAQWRFSPHPKGGGRKRLIGCTPQNKGLSFAQETDNTIGRAFLKMFGGAFQQIETFSDERIVRFGLGAAGNEHVVRPLIKEPLHWLLVEFGQHIQLGGFQLPVARFKG